jgi:signal transduction histidine kinase
MLEEHVDEAGAEYLDSVRTSAESAVELMTTARDLAEAMLATGESHQPVSLRNTLQTQLEETRATYGNAAITVSGEIPDVRVRADDMLTSIFRNLLKNAVHHNDKPVPVVEMSVEAGSDAVVVRVADNGPGIPEERRETIFGRGQKGLESEGTGIGLYLVRTLAEEYGGDVWIENNDPEGAVFAVELPRVEACT